MYLLLLVFGAVLGAAGVVLALSGVSLRDGTFDAAILTPGIVAAVGGLLLIGLGVGLRTLQRIEQALAVRPMPRALPLSETKPAELTDASREAPPIPFAPKASRQLLPRRRSAGVRHVAEKSPDNVAALGKMSPALPTIVVSPADKTNAAADTRACRKSRQRSGRSANSFPASDERAVGNANRATKGSGVRCAVAKGTAPIARPAVHTRSDGCGTGNRVSERCCAGERPGTS